ncbi:MAG: HEAT repeat domain-containing protein [Archangium sp.]
MRRFVLLLVFLSGSAYAQTRVSRCYETCNTYVSDARLRATSCASCLRATDDSHAWLKALPEVPTAMLADGDWKVRWAALTEQARRTNTTAQARLTAWTGKAQADELLRACLTAAHVVTPLPAACRNKSAEVRSSLEVQLYEEALARRVEALAALSRAFAIPRARVVLDVVASRAAEFDATLFDALAEGTPEGEVPPVAQLLAVAKENDVPAMNRLLAVVNARTNAARPMLEKDHATRIDAIRTLRGLLPTSASELMSVLSIDDLPARDMAMRAIANSEQRSISRMAEARFFGEQPASETQQAALLSLLGDVHDKDCAAVALRVWKTPGPLQRSALKIAAFCSWPETASEVEAALRAPEVWQRAAAVEALGFSPSSAQLQERLQFASNAKEPELRQAAAKAIGARRWRGGTQRVEALTVDPDAAVRVEALKAARALDAPGVENRLSRALENDVAPEVRRTAADLLALSASPLARASLEAALKKEKDESVKMVVERSLRRIRSGVTTP